MFHHKAHKQLRIALQPLLGQLGGQLFHGKDPKAYKAAKQGKRDLNRRQMMERAADRDSLNNTRMRSERLARLAALEAMPRWAPPVSCQTKAMSGASSAFMPITLYPAST